MRCATSCWLLVALTATTALAQTHPKKKPHHQLAVARKPLQIIPPVTEIKEDIYALCYLPFEGPTDSTVALALNEAYVYVEHMPKLPEASGMAGIMAAVQQLLLLPPTAPAGRVFVQFVVTKEGTVSQPQIVKGLRADVDSAVLAAARRLPRFTPGNQNGRVVPVCLKLLVPIARQQL